jgi:hypothetical protein
VEAINDLCKLYKLTPSHLNHGKSRACGLVENLTATLYSILRWNSSPMESQNRVPTPSVALINNPSSLSPITPHPSSSSWKFQSIFLDYLTPVSTAACPPPICCSVSSGEYIHRLWLVSLEGVFILPLTFFAGAGRVISATSHGIRTKELRKWGRAI